jgi:cell division protein FtsQ
VIVVGAGVQAIKAGLAARAAAEFGAVLVRLTADAGFTVQEVVVQGRRRAQGDHILNALGYGRGDPMLAVDPATAKARLEALDWVEIAAVGRRFPDRIHLVINERQPLALWQRDRRLVLVDHAGQVIAGQDPRDFPNLPLVVGDDGPAHLPALQEVVAGDTELAARIVAAIRVGGRRWNLRLDNGIDVRLPETGERAAWERLVALQQRHEVLERDIAMIDLRLPDRMVVRLSPTAIPADDNDSAAGIEPRGDDA